MKPASTDVFVESFERPNLRFEAVARKPGGGKSSLAAQVASAIGGRTPAIVYVLTTRAADELAEALTSGRNGGLTAAAYHAKLDQELRTSVHEAFLRDDPDGPSIIVATLAYGMGIDKPNVRTVVHAGAPASLEAYYQQAGRAGRDGLPSTCVLLWSSADVSAADQVRGGGGYQPPSLRAAIAQGTTDVQAYVASPLCRAAQLSDHFTGGGSGEKKKCRGGCDRCDYGDGDGPGAAASEDFGGEARRLMLAVRAINCRFGLGKAVSLLVSGSGRRKTDEPPPWLVSRFRELGGEKEQEQEQEQEKTNRSEAWWKSLAGLLIAERMIEYYTATVGGSSRSFSAPRLTAKGAEWIKGSATAALMLVPSDEMLREMATNSSSASARRPSTNASSATSSAGDKAAAAERRRAFLSGLLLPSIDRSPSRDAAALLEKPGDAAIDALEAYLANRDRDVEAVAAARGGVKPSTIVSSLARCAAHGMMPEAELDAFARRCGGFERGSEVALALAACMRDAVPPGAVGAALGLARSRGLTLGKESITYHHMHVAASIV